MHFGRMMSNSHDKNIFRAVSLDSNMYCVAEILDLWRPRIGVHKINKERPTKGVYHHLYPQLRQDPYRFYGYMAMSIQSFDLLLEKTENELESVVNVGEREIKPAEKLMVTLR